MPAQRAGPGMRGPLAHLCSGLPSHVLWRSEYRSDIKKFLKYALAHQDVWAVTISQFLDWMEKPVPASQVGRAAAAAPARLRMPRVARRGMLRSLLRSQRLACAVATARCTPAGHRLVACRGSPAAATCIPPLPPVPADEAVYVQVQMPLQQLSAQETTAGSAQP